MELPPKRTDARTVDSLVQLLRGAEIDADRIGAQNEQNAREGLPKRLDLEDTGIFTSLEGHAVQVIPNGSTNSLGKFVGATGFSCDLNMASVVTQGDVRSEFLRAVHKHDAPHVDELLLTVGGPDRDGYTYPSEEMFGALLASEMDLSIEAQHIRRVTVHTWGSGSIIDFPVR